MNNQGHLGGIYGDKENDEVSWFRPHLEKTLPAFIERAAPNHASRIIEIGTGESTLVDDLCAGLLNASAGYQTLYNPPRHLM